MRFSLVTAFAAALLLAACSTPSEEKASTSGTGTSGTTTTQTSPSAGTQSSTIPGPAAGSQEELTVEVGDRVFFDFDKYNIRPDQRGTVEALAAWLDTNPSVTLTIEGHCDERGTREYNLALGDRRAYAVKEFLVSLGVDASRLQTKSYGKERPVCADSDDSCWQQNRRGYSVISSGAGS